MKFILIDKIVDSDNIESISVLENSVRTRLVINNKIYSEKQSSNVNSNYKKQVNIISFKVKYYNNSEPDYYECSSEDIENRNEFESLYHKIIDFWSNNQTTIPKFTLSYKKF